MFSVHQIKEFLPTRRAIDEQLDKLLQEDIVVVSTLDEPQEYWLKRFNEFFNDNTEFMMIDMDQVRGSIADYLAVSDTAREYQVILFKHLSRSDQDDVFDLKKHCRIWIITDNVEADKSWLPQEATYVKPAEQKSLEGGGDMKMTTDDDDYDVVDLPEVDLSGTEL